MGHNNNNKIVMTVAAAAAGGAGLLLLLLLLSANHLATAASDTSTLHHTSNWAVIVDTSIFWFNYRHASNALAVYWACKAGGIPGTTTTSTRET
jgi:glycosylphosphatidylinositol transamidase (GPIT) subunit GPI8